MKIMSLQQFIRQPQVPEYQEVLVVTVRDLLRVIEANYSDGWVAEVTLDAPEPDSISVKFKPAEETEP